MNNEKTFICDVEKDERLFKINDGLLLLMVAGGLLLNFCVFSLIGDRLLKPFGLEMWGYLAGGIFSLVVSGFLSNAIHNWGVRRLEKMESKKLKDEMA